MRRIQRWRRQLYRRIVQLEASPHRVGLGAALGVLFGTLMPPGLQLITCIPVALLCRASAVAAAAGTCISNPITYVPLYYFTCRVGERVLQLLGSPVDLGRGLRALLAQAGRCVRAGALRGLFSGSTAGFFPAAPTYALTYLIVVESHRVREFARARRAARHRALAEKQTATTEGRNGESSTTPTQAPHNR